MSDNVVIDLKDFKHNNDLLKGLKRKKKSKEHYSTQESNLFKNIEKFNQAKEKIKQKIIYSDNSNDKTTVYTAITQFKKTNE